MQALKLFGAFLKSNINFMYMIFLIEEIQPDYHNRNPKIQKKKKKKTRNRKSVKSYYLPDKQLY